jgi:hypothetical protein
MCRVRGRHFTAPWTTAYVCIKLDASCTNEKNEYITDVPLTATTIREDQLDKGYVTKQAVFDVKTPVCGQCKRANRTKVYCRRTHMHRALPWTTLYVVLSAAGDGGGAATVAKGGTTNNGDNEVDGNNTEDVADNNNASRSKSGSSSDDNDINCIAESRTFLAMVSCKENSILWLEETQQQCKPAVQSNITTNGGVPTDPRIPPLPNAMLPQMQMMQYSPTAAAAAFQAHYRNIRMNHAMMVQQQNRMMQRGDGKSSSELTEASRKRLKSEAKKAIAEAQQQQHRMECQWMQISGYRPLCEENTSDCPPETTAGERKRDGEEVKGINETTVSAGAEEKRNEANDMNDQLLDDCVDGDILDQAVTLLDEGSFDVEDDNLC